MKRDPERDCRIYHVKTRAKEIFNALDLDESGYVDEDEFISGCRSKEKLIIVNIDIIKSYYLNISILGCLRDEVFVDILENFDADKLWGKFGL